MKESPQKAPDKKAQRSEPARVPAPMASPVLAAAGLTLDALGNRATLALLRSGRLQRKACVSRHDDPLEHDADRAADAVVSDTRVPAVRRVAATDIQRMGTDEQELAVALGLGSKRADPRAAAAPEERAPTDAEVGYLYGGEPLDAQTLGVMESRFAENFGDVRVHTGSRAAETADTLEAYAFTVGEDIVFAEGQFAPETTEGRRLLAHELAHVVQQRSPIGAPAPEATTEAEADRAADGAEFGGPVTVESSADPGEIQRQPKPGRKTSEVIGTTVAVDGKYMAYIMHAENMKKSRPDIWDSGSRVLSVGISTLGRHYKLEKYPDGDQNAKDLDIVVDITATSMAWTPAGGEKRWTSHVTVGSRTPAKPATPKPPAPKPSTPTPQGPPTDEPGDQPAQEQKDDKRGETKPSAGGGDKVNKVENKSESDPKGALEDAGDLSPRELKTMGPGTRKNLLDAAARAPRDSSSPQLAKDLITTTPDRDAGPVSDALQADGGKLLQDLKSKADPETATELDEAAKDLAARRIDASEPDPGKDIVELTPEMKKKADEIRALFKKMGTKRTYGLDEVRVDENWPIVKGGMEQKFQAELRNLERDVKRWNEEHAALGVPGDSASDIAKAAQDEAAKAFETMRAAKTERELYEGWRAATHALWRANQMMDAKKTLDRFESSVSSWKESQSGLAAIAAVPSHVLGGVSRDRPDEIAAEARSKVDAALKQLRDATTREEKIEAATRLKQVLADANFKLTGHKEEVEEGAERLIIGIEVVAATTVVILAPEVAIPGMLIGGGLGTAREGALMIDDPNHQFSGRAVFDSAVIGTVLAPLAANSAVVAYGVLPGMGIYSGSGEIQKGHYVTGAFDIVTGLAPIGIKATTGRGPALPTSRSLQAAKLTLVLRYTAEGIEGVPGVGGRNPTPSIPRGPEIAWVMEAPGTSARTPGGIIVPGETSVSPDVTPGFGLGAPSPKPPAPTWATVQQPGSYAPTPIPFTVNIAPPAPTAVDPFDAAFSEDAQYDVGSVKQVGRVRTTASGRQFRSLEEVSLTADQRQAATQVHGQQMAPAHQAAWRNAVNARETAELAEVNRLWNEGTPQSRQQARDLAREAFNRHRGRYWAAVRSDPALRAAFENAGMRFTGGRTTAPIYDLPDGTAARMTLEHSTRLADDPARALDANNLQFVLDDENSVVLEFLRANDPFQ